jgi:hypothetical protein
MTRPGLTFAQRIIPPELVEHRGDLRFTVQEFTAIDLAADRPARRSTAHCAAEW